MRASAPLDDGAWTLAQSRQAIGRAARLLDHQRDLILTYRSHRFRVISGSSDVNDAQRGAIVRTLALQAMKTLARFSRGGVCMLCGQPIERDTPEYEIEAAAVTMTLDVACYNVVQRQVTESASATLDDRRPSARPLDGLTILVVDDHQDTLDMVEQYLTAFGAGVLSSDTAKGALVLAESHVVDAALVDLRMPREDGWWFLRQLRASRTASAEAKVFAVSGDHHDPGAWASGFAGFFLKPVDMDRLVAALAALPRRSS